MLPTEYSIYVVVIELSSDIARLLCTLRRGDVHSVHYA